MVGSVVSVRLAPAQFNLLRGAYLADLRVWDPPFPGFDEWVSMKLVAFALFSSERREALASLSLGLPADRGVVSRAFVMEPEDWGVLNAAVRADESRSSRRGTPIGISSLAREGIEFTLWDMRQQRGDFEPWETFLPKLKSIGLKSRSLRVAVSDATWLKVAKSASRSRLTVGQWIAAVVLEFAHLSEDRRARSTPRLAVTQARLKKERQRRSGSRSLDSLVVRTYPVRGSESFWQIVDAAIVLDLRAGYVVDRAGFVREAISWALLRPSNNKPSSL